MLTREESNRFAIQIEVVKLACQDLDWNYANELVNAFCNQDDRQEALMVINPMHPPAVNALLREQTLALRHLIGFMDTLKRCDELKKEVASQYTIQEKIKSIFL